MKKLLVFIVCISLLLTPIGCGAKAKKPTPAPARPLVVGFYVNDTGTYDSLKSLTAHANLINEIHPQWYHVKPDGSMEKNCNAADYLLLPVSMASR